MRTLLLVSICACISSGLFAGDGNAYDIAKMPADLKTNAHVVKRYENSVFELNEVGKAKFYYKYALTILDEQGDKHAALAVAYDRFIEMRSIDGALFDASGKKIKELKRADIKDISGSGEDALVDDNRYKIHEFYNRTYPYTVEYEVELKFNGTLFFPDWMPVDGEHYAVESSNFSVICPSGYKLRYKPMNTAIEPQVVEKNDRKTYSWELKNIKAIEEEYASKSWPDLVPHLIIGASEFKMEDYKGNMETWKDFGKFVYALKEGRDQLPDNIKATVHQLTDGVQDPREKVQKLYEFMQGNTRYVGIQLGIGGWQPFDATYVATKRYGDCKALSNYMYSLLKEAGIPSFYTLIHADRYDKSLVLDFPSSQFNHVILCVPMQKDTVWLECTSQTDPAGFLGFHTYDRPALLIDEEGGKIVNTPKYTLKDNLQIRRVNGTIDLEGNLKADVKTYYTGLQQADLYDMIHALSKDKVMEVLKEEIDLATYDVEKFEYKPQKSNLPAIDERLDLNISHYASVTGKRIFVNPNVMSRINTKVKPVTERKYAIEFGYEYRDVDTAFLKLPVGYKIEAMPADVNVSSAFGNYKSQVRVIGEEIIYYRIFEKKSGEFPATSFEELMAFYDKLYKADRGRVVLVKIE